MIEGGRQWTCDTQSTIKICHILKIYLEFGELENEKKMVKRPIQKSNKVGI